MKVTMEDPGVLKYKVKEARDKAIREKRDPDLAEADLKRTIEEEQARLIRGRISHEESERALKQAGRDFTKFLGGR